jgi:hypothetical protein
MTQRQERVLVTICVKLRPNVCLSLSLSYSLSLSLSLSALGGCQSAREAANAAGWRGVVVSAIWVTAGGRALRVAGLRASPRRYLCDPPRSHCPYASTARVSPPVRVKGLNPGANAYNFLSLSLCLSLSVCDVGRAGRAALKAAAEGDDDDDEDEDEDEDGIDTDGVGPTDTGPPA